MDSRTAKPMFRREREPIQLKISSSKKAETSGQYQKKKWRPSTNIKGRSGDKNM
jgi:hypothetical protein